MTQASHVSFLPCKITRWEKVISKVSRSLMWPTLPTDWVNEYVQEDFSLVALTMLKSRYILLKMQHSNSEVSVARNQTKMVIIWLLFFFSLSFFLFFFFWLFVIQIVTKVENLTLFKELWHVGCIGFAPKNPTPTSRNNFLIKAKGTPCSNALSFCYLFPSASICAFPYRVERILNSTRQ